MSERQKMFCFFDSIEDVTDDIINDDRVIETNKEALRISKTGKTFIKFRNGDIPSVLQGLSGLMSYNDGLALLQTDDWENGDL